MPKPIERVARSVLAGRQTDICASVYAAWHQWQALPMRAQLYKRARATLVHNFMVLDARARFTSDTGIREIARCETSYFLIDDQVLIRFKKGDERGISSNIDTQLSLAFCDPQAQLFDLPQVFRVDIAYVLNRFETQIEDIRVVARDNERVDWSYSMLPPAAIQPVFKLPPRMPAPPVRGTLVTAIGRVERRKKK